MTSDKGLFWDPFELVPLQKFFLDSLSVRWIVWYIAERAPNVIFPEKFF